MSDIPAANVFTNSALLYVSNHNTKQKSKLKAGQNRVDIILIELMSQLGKVFKFES